MSFGEELQSHVRDRYLDALSTFYFPIVTHILLYQNLPAQYTNLATKALNVQASRFFVTTLISTIMGADRVLDICFHLRWFCWLLRTCRA